MLSFIMLNAIMLSVVMLGVVAPQEIVVSEGIAKLMVKLKK
jgi:hypothetical protein